MFVRRFSPWTVWTHFNVDERVAGDHSWTSGSHVGLRRNKSAVTLGPPVQLPCGKFYSPNFMRDRVRAKRVLGVRSALRLLAAGTNGLRAACHTGPVLRLTSCEILCRVRGALSWWRRGQQSVNRVSHPVSICDELLQATLHVVFFLRDSFVFSVVRRGHHHPHRSVKAWSGALLLAARL